VVEEFLLTDSYHAPILHALLANLHFPLNFAAN
jgi:hypothetical protein